MLPENVSKSLDKIARSLGFVEYKLEIGAGSKAGDNFAGEIISISISDTQNQNREKLHLVCKIPGAIDVDSLYEREVFTYSKVLPFFEKFQRDNGLSDADSFLSYPKVYNCDSNSNFLIMENLKFQNYRMWPKFNNVPFDHELLFVKELGKFHGISFAMKDQQPDEFEQFKQLNDVLSGFFSSESMRPAIARSLGRTTGVLEDSAHKKIVQDFKENYEREMEMWFCDESSKKFAVVSHGDAWINNFLFQYPSDESKSAQNIAFLDWQITRYCSPAFDFLHQVLASGDKSFRDKHYGSLMEAYYKSLSDTIRKLGSNPDELFTFEDFQSELKKFGRFAMLVGSIIYQVRLADASDFAKTLMSDLNGNRHELYCELVNGFFTDLSEYGYIQ